MADMLALWERGEMTLIADRFTSVVLAGCMAGLLPLTAHAQTSGTWSPPRTTDGQPDIQGVWTNFDPTPFEAPSEVDIERLAPLARWFPGTNQPPAPPAPETPAEEGEDGIKESAPEPAAAATPAMTEEEAEEAARLQELWNFADGPRSASRNDRRRSMVVDPPTGRIPVREEAVSVRNERLVNLTDSWMNHTPWERCITRGVPGGIFPPGYGAGYRFLQTPGYVVIIYEMIHEARIIPLDGRPYVDGKIRQWNGDSRGWWEDNTLVVEIRNYNDRGTIATNIATRGARGLPRTEDLHIVERFAFVDLNTIQYEVTIHDPDVYTAPWKVAMPLNKDRTYDLFEYACHEGNYGLENSLSAGRAEDLAASATETGR